jgi:hypothetical protein
MVVWLILVSRIIISYYYLEKIMWLIIYDKCFIVILQYLWKLMLCLFYL